MRKSHAVTTQQLVSLSFLINKTIIHRSLFKKSIQTKKYIIEHTSKRPLTIQCHSVKKTECERGLHQITNNFTQKYEKMNRKRVYFNTNYQSKWFELKQIQ